MSRGYFGIGVVNLQKEVNYGTLFRSALCFGADFIFLIGKRFHKQASDTVKSYRHIPLYEYTTWEEFKMNMPYGCVPVAVEITESAKSITSFCHPERAVYVLGPENSSLSHRILADCFCTIKIPSAFCLNVSVAGSVVMYDRVIKEMWGK